MRASLTGINEGRSGYPKAVMDKLIGDLFKHIDKCLTPMAVPAKLEHGNQWKNITQVKDQEPEEEVKEPEVPTAHKLELYVNGKCMIKDDGEWYEGTIHREDRQWWYVRFYTGDPEERQVSKKNPVNIKPISARGGRRLCDRLFRSEGSYGKRTKKN